VGFTACAGWGKYLGGCEGGGREVSEEERGEMERRFHAVSENGQLKGFDQRQADFRNRALEEADARIIKDGPLLGKNPPFPFHKHD
jgi:hypothetical protein